MCLSYQIQPTVVRYDQFVFPIAVFSPKLVLLWNAGGQRWAMSLRVLEELVTEPGQNPFYLYTTVAYACLTKEQRRCSIICQSPSNNPRECGTTIATTVTRPSFNFSSMITRNNHFRSPSVYTRLRMQSNPFIPP